MQAFFSFSFSLRLDEVELNHRWTPMADQKSQLRADAAFKGEASAAGGLFEFIDGIFFIFEVQLSAIECN